MKGFHTNHSFKKCRILSLDDSIESDQYIRPEGVMNN